jgi:hypothetical protein
MDQNKIGFFSRIFYSMSKMDFYVTVAKESVRKAFKYLVLFCILLGAINSIIKVVGFFDAISEVKKFVTKDIPDFTFKNGELNVEGEMPIVVESDDLALIVDTSGELDESSLDGYNEGIFISKTYIVSKKNVMQKERIDFAELGALSFTKSSLIAFLPTLKILGFLFPIFIIIATIIGKLIGSLFVSIITAIVGAVKKVNLSYGQTYAIGIYAMTLPSIIKFIANLLSLKIPLFFVVYYAIVIIYAANAFSRIQQDRLAAQAKTEDPLTQNQWNDLN